MDKYGSDNSKSRRTSKLHDRFKRYNDFNDVFLSMINKGFFGSVSSQLWIMGDSGGEGRWLLALVTGGR